MSEYSDIFEALI